MTDELPCAIKSPSPERSW